MEQYELVLDKVYENIQYCLKNYKAKRIFIRLVGSMGGTKKVNEDLENRTFDIKQVFDGLSILIDGSEVFKFEQEGDWGKSFSLGYKRDPDETGVISALSTGINPDDPNLPPVNTSFFRSCNYYHLLEIYFEGKIPLKFHSHWNKKAGWKYWCVDTEAIGKK
jgi:hypothetical protein